MRSWPDIVPAVWILILSIALFCNLNNRPLSQDEAASALNSLTISWKNPIPKGAPNEEPALQHEMALYYKTDDPKYEYLPTHFMFTPYVTIHGWVPYYFIRAGIEIFGKNNFAPNKSGQDWLLQQDSLNHFAKWFHTFPSLLCHNLTYHNKYLKAALFFHPD